MISPTIMITILNGAIAPSITLPIISVMASRGFSCFADADWSTAVLALLAISVSLITDCEFLEIISTT